MYSKASGTTTADTNPDPQKANFRQRPLLTVDEVVTPQIGNCTIFARYVEPAFATYIITHQDLTRAALRQPAVVEWKAELAKAHQEQSPTVNNNPYAFDNTWWGRNSSKITTHQYPRVTPSFLGCSMNRRNGTIWR